MRTTVTLEPDVQALIQEDMRRRGVSFKRALNDAVRTGLLAPAPDAPRYEVQARSMGEPSIPLTKALRVAAELEDDEIVRKLTLGK